MDSAAYIFLYWSLIVLPSLHDLILVWKGDFELINEPFDDELNNLEMIGRAGGNRSPQNELVPVGELVDIDSPREAVPICKLCQDKLYEEVRIVKRQLGCSHTVCRECVLKHGGSDWRCCPFCKLTGIINGDASRKEKQKAREDLKNAIQKF
ncbi:hypothetical protein B9Z55_008678 [Caenorhabditis nigoni]|uniref:RING-type domain-containing protein n=1 Tax=Caenorhabditis nigoni TaxID=1611254 RepID=A0A2G5UP74_9PELO|nr:hypothetical protein B9Z55_008678 [Caenorhabditis nigoni]